MKEVNGIAGIMFVALLACGWEGVVTRGLAAESPERRVADAMARAATFYREEVSTHGGYVYYYAEDLGKSWGEGEATPDQVWVQPPGTPTVGMAFLEAHSATGGPYYLEAAVEAAEALVYGQLESGGWTNLVDFDPDGKRRGNYRNGRGSSKGKNFSTLDDGITQAALQLLMRVDRALEGRNAAIRDAVETGLDALLAAQFPNGGFPQGWVGPVETHPGVSARYPDNDWRTEGRIKNYWDLYTLNDGLAGTVAETLMEAHASYGDDRFETALAKLGDFLLLAQMPEPQRAWAQQYNYDMIPVWARKFEPAAIAGRESQDVLRTLLVIHEATGNPKYLGPVPGALAYLKSSVLPDGQLARYYELKTNKPLYMSRRGDEYRLTYDDRDLPGHYGWKGSSELEEIEEIFRRARAGMAPEKNPVAGRELEKRVENIIGELDGRGAWVSTATGERLVGQPKFTPGMRYISSAVFSENLETLAAYVGASKAR